MTEDSNQLKSMRHNVYLLLQYGSVVPFQWTTKGFKCFYCSKQLKDCETVRIHTVEKHSKVDLFEFIHTKIISKDFPIKIDVTDISCNECESIFNDIENLIAHIKVVHEENFDASTEKFYLPFMVCKNDISCVLCGCKYDNFTSIVHHMYQSHIDRSVICQNCGLSFTSKARLMRHMKDTHKDHKCKVCLKVFDVRYKLQRHKERFHGKMKSFECDLCSERLETSYLLKVHLGKVHNVEKYHITCELCSKVCSTKGAMVFHVRSVHSQVKYKCDQCEYTASIQWKLKLHQRKHTKTKDYSCSVCEKMFRRSSNLSTHMKLHSGTPGRVCRYCRKGFLNADALKEHADSRCYLKNEDIT